MGIEWLKELGLGFLWIFAQPILYIAMAYTFWTGYHRIKNERQMFGHRVFPIGAEWKKTWWLGIMFGSILSIALIISGSMLTYELLLVLSVIVFIITLLNQTWLLSPIYSVGLLAVGVWAWSTFSTISVPWLNRVTQVDLVLISYLLVVFLLAEIVLVSTTKRNHTFPEMKKGDRGKFIGSHVAKRLMFIPFFAPVPGEALEFSLFDWWPVFGIGDRFELMLVPFVIGYSQRYQGSFSEIGSKSTAKWLSGLSIIVIAGAVGIYFFDEFAIVLVAVAVLGRAAIHLIGRYLDSEKRPIFTPRTDGIIVVGVIPESPADQMGIQIGEKIEKIHDIEVTNEHEFYEVMSENRTFCKLTVRDLNDEVRFVQRALYEGEYHELGLIFVKETPRFTLKTEDIG